MTRRPSRAPNYDRKLTRRIVLDDGAIKSWRLLEIAIERLIAASESVERDTVKAASEAIERVLLDRRLL